MTAKSIPISPQTVKHEFRLLLQDGYVNEQPHLEAIGHYRQVVALDSSQAGFQAWVEWCS